MTRVYKERDHRHLYANLHDPVVCPLLSLGMYLSICSVTGIKDSSLFPVSSQYKRFANYLQRILKEHASQIMDDFGVDTKNLGVHSLRKGAASYISSGSTCASPQVATNIRAGWTMCVIQDTHIYDMKLLVTNTSGG